MRDRYATVHLRTGILDSPDSTAVERDDIPFELVVLGDFSGRASRGAHRQDISDIAPIRVDRDDLDAVLGHLRPRVRLRFDDSTPTVEIEFRELDDFHPDTLCEHSPVFEGLRRLRRRALDPAELPAVAAELGLATQQGGTGASAEGPAADRSVLDRILERSQPSPVGPLRIQEMGPSGMKEVARRIVAPHVVSRNDPRRAEVLSTIDAAVGAGMRLLLHHPDFRGLEALWRALHFLVRRVDTGPRLHISIIDLSGSELASDLDGSASAGVLRRLLAGDALRARPTLLVATWEFGRSEEDLALLAALAELGRQVGAPCLTAGTPLLVGARDSASLSEPEGWEAPTAAWEALRRHPDGAWLGVVLPRFLLRLPYGEDGEECDGLAFEELSSPPPGHEFLWGNPAIACASLLAGSFVADGWGMRPGTLRDVDDLPLYLAREDDETIAQPAAEVLLPQTAAERLLELGVMPLASLRDRGAARLVRFQSIADPPAPLAGRWATA